MLLKETKEICFKYAWYKREQRIHFKEAAYDDRFKPNYLGDFTLKFQ